MQRKVDVRVTLADSAGDDPVAAFKARLLDLPEHLAREALQIALDGVKHLRLDISEGSNLAAAGTGDRGFRLHVVGLEDLFGTALAAVEGRSNSIHGEAP